MLRAGRFSLSHVHANVLARSPLVHAASIPTMQTRFQSQSVNNNASTGEKLASLSDEQVDEWLKVIGSLEEEFSQQDYNPATSLAPGNQSRINILEKAMELNKPSFEPSQEQINEWETLKQVPIPKKQDPVLQHVTNMIMRHGKRERAEKILSRALYIVFCQTRKDPVKVLKESLDVLAPLMVIKTFKTGVAKATVVPVPLNQRQRFRLAWKWIVESSVKRSSSDFSVRLGEELVSVFNGNSSGFEKRDSIHKTAIAHRAYINLK
ncbi:mitochondrial 37S ribosomal protein uS7m [Kluyveromyces lactis]|uniref:Small ribosomal subunit protein uS7m n=1 Tax=Kluyveromyces lactis (strain ATCC 8585 / CBS 2359 / DSM 70799 / NBRC 1267 / NRRL Y-1140 / WM37) TaxID=284590 RepID=Q6CPD4_KLULA|nr:mitochondrial 37S ribosomal protein RSM7 [Kluyveromyces lactis]CAG99292.1 KLLA0E05743p [Kluyveromyces lactis]|eukprot:XP_454205.1 mitochondrial 37S ribosomal protein RSM7 [Kluyveromyces lactis]